MPKKPPEPPLRLSPHVQGDSEETAAFARLVAEKAGCHEGCGIIFGWLIRSVAFCLHHRVGPAKAEMLFEEIGRDEDQRERIAGRLAAWVKAQHDALAAWEAE